MRKVIAILAGVLLPIAAAAQPSAPVKPAAGKAPAASLDTRPKVALIVAIGQRFSVRKIGTKMFGEDMASVPIEGWGIDTLVSSKAAAMLKKRFDVVPVKAWAETGARLMQAPEGLFSGRDGYLCDTLRKAAPGQFAYYVWVKPTVAKYGSTDVKIYGLGIAHGNFALNTSTSVHALFALEVLDGRDCGSVRVVEPSSPNDMFETIGKGMHMKVDDSWVPAQPQAVAQDARLRGTIRQLVEEGLAQALPQALATD
jgi:hypothetical protein